MKRLLYIAFGFVVALAFVHDDGSLPTPSQPIERTPSQQPPQVAPAQSLVEPEKANTIFSGSWYVTGSRVNFRLGPSLQHEVVGTLTRGAKISSGRVTGGWTQIRLNDGREGWMASRYLSQILPKLEQRPVRTVSTPSSREITAARKEIIRQSIAAYPGSCPCPYNTDRAGRRCGGRSAWSKPGGYSPICYDSDVTPPRLETYFARQR